jgi:hypothetical protein
MVTPSPILTWVPPAAADDRSLSGAPYYNSRAMPARKSLIDRNPADTVAKASADTVAENVTAHILCSVCGVLG